MIIIIIIVLYCIIKAPTDMYILNNTPQQVQQYNIVIYKTILIVRCWNIRGRRKHRRATVSYWYPWPESIIIIMSLINHKAMQGHKTVSRNPLQQSECDGFRSSESEDSIFHLVMHFRKTSPIQPMQVQRDIQYKKKIHSHIYHLPVWLVLLVVSSYPGTRIPISRWDNHIPVVMYTGFTMDIHRLL